MHPELGRRNLVAPHVLRNDMETCRASERTQCLPRSSTHRPVLNSDLKTAAVVNVRLQQVRDGRFITACHTRSITAR